MKSNKVLNYFIKIVNRIIALLHVIKIKYYLIILSNNKIMSKPHIIQPVLFSGLGLIKISHSTQLGYNPSPKLYSGYIYIEARYKESNITIGNNTFINNNATIISEGAGIYIGDNCLIGTDFEVFDSDFHNIDYKKRNQLPETKKVIINDNVFIGNRVSILKGVKIGKNSVIGAGSVVVKNIPENVLSAGNPACVIRKIV